MNNFLSTTTQNAPISFNKPKLNSFDIRNIFSNIVSQWYFYLLFIAVIAIAISFCFLFKPQEKINFKKSTKIAIIAMLSALCFIVNAFAIGPQNVKFSFVSLVCFIAGYILGPLSGLSVGFIGDLIAGIILPQGVFSPFISLASSLFAFIPGVIFGYFKGNEYIKTAICFVITYIICSVILNTTATYFLYIAGSPKYDSIFAYLTVRLPLTIVGQIVNFAICLALISPLKRIKKMLTETAK